MISFYVIEETSSAMRLIAPLTAEARLLRWHPRWGWLTEDEYNNYENIVRYWRDGDQSNWYDTIAAPAANRVLNNIVGFAFKSEISYDLPTEVYTDRAFYRYKYVFVPDGVADPRTNVIVVPAPVTPTTPAATTMPGGAPAFPGDATASFDEEPPEEMVAPAPAAGRSSVVVIGVSLGLAALTGLAAWMIQDRFRG